MNISVKGEYALSAMFDLAGQPRERPVKIADIARRQKIPQKFLELILAGLKQAGFVESKRGAEGGYLLARSAGSISIADILRHTEGSPGKAMTRRKRESPFTDMWKRVDDAVAAVVERTTLEDLHRAWNEKQMKYVPNWEI